MQSWVAADVPDLPGSGGPVRLFDTAAGAVRTLSPGATARMYVCGITPYDATHLGHAATYLAFDLLHRLWRDAGHQVRYVQNVTDVDDPLLERAARDGQDWADLAAREIDRFRADMAALRVLPPTDLVGAVEAIEEIVPMVERLLAAGAAYDLDGDVYFSVAAEPRFGEVAHLDVPTMIGYARERGGDPDRPGKKDPLDPILWRAGRAGEPSWPAPFGVGRPGWHVECAAIAVGRLGMGFDVQGGGSDLAFPHHECSAAHAQAATGRRPFAGAYAHAGMIGLAGEKMSKSRGNLVFVSRLLADGVDPAEIRLALLAGHYRTDRPFTSELLDAAAGRFALWRRAAARPAGPAAEPVLAAVRSRLADDLDTPGALAAVDGWATAALAGAADGGQTAPGLLARTVDALLGVELAG